MGRRIAAVITTTGGVTTTHFIYDSRFRVVEERSSESAWVARYTYGEGVDEALLMERGGNDYYLHRDALGSITEVTGDGGSLVERYEYDVYGQPLFFDGSYNAIGASAIGNPYLFTGRRYDAESGNYYYRARMVSPGLGRFLSMDPLGFGAGDANLYRYVFSNPVNLTDPSGMILSTAGGVGQALLNIILGALQLDACGNLPDEVVIVDIGHVGAMPISVIILPPGSGRLPPSQTLGKAFNTVGAANDVVEALSALALVPAAPEFAGFLDVVWALLGSYFSGDTFAGRPHRDAPQMIAIGQDVWVTGLEAALVPPIKAGLFSAGFYFGSLPGGVAGAIAGGVFDAGTSTASFFYDTGRLTGAIPNVVSLALYFDTIFPDHRMPTKLPLPFAPVGQPAIAILIYQEEWFIFDPLLPQQIG